MKAWGVVLFFTLVPVFLFGQTDLQNMSILANKYFQDKEYGKAAELYEQLYSGTKSEGYFNIYFDCLMLIHDYEKAEKTIKKGLRGNSSDSFWYVQWGYLKKTTGKVDEADKLYQKALGSVTNDPNELFSLANQFINRREYEYAEKVFLKAREQKGGGLYHYELARVYFYMRSYDRMMGEYLDWLNQKDSNIEIVKSNLMSIMSMDRDGEVMKQLKIVVLKRIQQNPNQVIYNRMLIWLFVQEKSFVAALHQAIALDKRTGEEDANIFDLANISASNKFYDEAGKAYEYIINKEKKTEFFALAAIQLVRMNYSRFIDETPMDVAKAKELQSSFSRTVALLGPIPETIDLVIDYAHLLTFYLNQPTGAIKILNDALTVKGISQQQILGLKEELGDVNVYSGDLWEAVIVYSQVIESRANGTLVDDVKFKKAKLGYYMGNFKWAKAQLDVLRASTSKLIANDAMELSLFINENLESDSVAAPLRMFARADLQVFRNNYAGAMTVLDSVASRYPDHSLVDDVDFRKATIMAKTGKYDEAANLFNEIVKNFSFDLLADNALFQLGLLYENKLNRRQDAMDTFKKLMTGYPGSVYVVDARAEYRKLEGTENAPH